MKCYGHSHVDACGLCKHCFKAVCVECGIDTGDGLACSERCALEVNDVQALIQNSKIATASEGKASWLLPAFFVAIGCSFFWYGFGSGGRVGPSTVLGLLMVLFGLAIYLLNRTYFKRVRNVVPSQKVVLSPVQSSVDQAHQ
jgi:hypothetical protein